MNFNFEFKLEVVLLLVCVYLYRYSFQLCHATSIHSEWNLIEDVWMNNGKWGNKMSFIFLYRKETFSFFYSSVMVRIFLSLILLIWLYGFPNVSVDRTMSFKLWNLWLDDFLNSIERNFIVCSLLWGLKSLISWFSLRFMEFIDGKLL